jgi:hypothetical protein
MEDTDRDGDYGRSEKAKNEANEAADRDLSKRLKKLKERAKKRKDPWIPHFQEVYDYVFPYREGFFDQADGQRKTDFIFDQTAVVGVPRFASRIQQGLFPPQGRAFSLSPGVDFPADKRTRDVQAELDQICQAMHEGLRNSNFESELHEGAQDLGIGTMTLMVEPGIYPGDIKFTSVPANNLFILPGGSDSVGTWIYERKLSFQECFETWPRAKPNHAMQQGLKNNPDAMVTIQQITVADPMALYEPRYQYYLFCPDHDCVLDRRTYEGIGSCPWITARWSKMSTEVWGRGPILQVLPSIKTVNLTVQMVLENAELAISGVFAYDDDGVFNPDNMRIEPGMFVPKAPGSKIEPLQSPARFDVSQIILGDERANIRKGLFIDELERDAKTPYSAEEVGQRMADTARNMGSVSGRLWTELMQPLVQRIAYIYRKQGIFKLPRIDGKEISMTPLSPLLRVQDQADISNFIQYVQVMNGTLGPGSSTMTLNRKRTIDWLNKKFGMEDSIINSDAEINRNIQAVVGAAQATENGPELMKTAVQSGLKVLQ